MDPKRAIYCWNKFQWAESRRAGPVGPRDLARGWGGFGEDFFRGCRQVAFIWSPSDQEDGGGRRKREESAHLNANEAKGDVPLTASVRLTHAAYIQQQHGSRPFWYFSPESNAQRIDLAPIDWIRFFFLINSFNQMSWLGWALLIDFIWLIDWINFKSMKYGNAQDWAGLTGF